jgi:hypothetical protein
MVSRSAMELGDLSGLQLVRIRSPFLPRTGVPSPVCHGQKVALQNVIADRNPARICRVERAGVADDRYDLLRLRHKPSRIFDLAIEAVAAREQGAVRLREAERHRVALVR